MTNEQRKAIELLERIHVSYFLSGMIEQSNYIVDKAYEADKAIDTVLSLIKEQDKYIKDANDITTEMSNDIKKLTSEIEKKDKQIDLMAEYWNTGLAMCDNCDRIVEKYEENNCENCIKRYFAGLAERKVEE